MKHLISLSFLAVFFFGLVKSDRWLADDYGGYDPYRWPSSLEIGGHPMKPSNAQDEEEQLQNLVEREKRSPRGPRPGGGGGPRGPRPGGRQGRGRPGGLTETLTRMQEELGDFDVNQFASDNQLSDSEKSKVQDFIEAAENGEVDGEMEEKFKALDPGTRRLLGKALRPSKEERKARREQTITGEKLETVIRNGLSGAIPGMSEADLTELQTKLLQSDFSSMEDFAAIRASLKELGLRKNQIKELIKYAMAEIAKMETAGEGTADEGTADQGTVG